MIENKRVILNMRKDQYEVLQKLQEKFRLMSVAEVVRYIITESEDRHLNNYKVIAQKKMATQITDPAQKELAKIKAQEINADLKKQRFTESRTAIIESMNGTVDKDGNAVWSAYIEEQGQRITKYTITRDLETVPNDLPDYLFRTPFANPSKPAKARARYRELIEMPQNKDFKEEIENLLNKLYPNG